MDILKPRGLAVGYAPANLHIMHPAQIRCPFWILPDPPCLHRTQNLVYGWVPLMLAWPMPTSNKSISEWQETHLEATRRTCSWVQNAGSYGPLHWHQVTTHWKTSTLLLWSSFLLLLGNCPKAGLLPKSPLVFSETLFIFSCAEIFAGHCLILLHVLVDESSASWSSTLGVAKWRLCETVGAFVRPVWITFLATAKANSNMSTPHVLAWFYDSLSLPSGNLT